MRAASRTIGARRRWPPPRPLAWVALAVVPAALALLRLAPDRRAATTPPPAAAAYGKLPLSFQPNRGQSARAVRFLAAGPGLGLFLTRAGAVLALGGGDAGTAGPAVSMRFLGAAADPSIDGVGRLPGTVNYLGAGPARGAGASHAPERGIPTYRGVRYTGLWPGIDARFYGAGGRLEYDFDLAPGARVGAIGLRFAGQRRLAIGPRGALLLRLDGRTLRQPRPRASQSIDGRVRAVPARYVLRGGGRVGFAVGPYDSARPLRIDPKVVYSTYLAEGIRSPAFAIAVDSSGSAYIAGATTSPRLPVTPGALGGKLPLRDGDVAFVTKLSPNGRRIVYSTYLGGPGGSTANAIAVDGGGAAYVGGWAYPRGMPTTAGALQTQPLGEPISGFVAKLAPSGRRLLYSTYLAGKGVEGGEVNAIAIDAAGDAYVAGETGSESFPVTPGAAQAPGPGAPAGLLSPNVFIAKLDPFGARLLYSTILGGSAWDTAGGIAIDPAGDAYVTGATASRDFPTTPGAFQAENRAGDPESKNAYVAELDPRGEHFLYATYLGGDLSDEADAIAVDPEGRAYVTGEAISRDFPTTAGALQRRSRGLGDAFVAILAPGGGRLLHSTFLGRETSGRDIGLDAAGDPYIVGFRGAAERRGRFRGERGFLAELNPSLARLRLWRRLGGNHARAAALALGPAGDVYAAGGSGPGLEATNTLTRIRLGGGRPGYPSAFVTRLRR